MQCSLSEERKYVVVLASGVGKRMGTSLPKQFMCLKGKPVLLHTLEKIRQTDKSFQIVLVLNPAHVHYWEEIEKQYDVDIPCRVVLGGKERFYSVRNALMTIEDEQALVAIHDGVRPFVDKEILEDCFSTAKKYGNAISCVQSTDSVRLLTSDNDSRALERKNIMLVQTPQCFVCSTLKKAYSQPYCDSFTDDASVVENLGEKIHLSKGKKQNIKITTIEDIKTAESLL